MRAFKQLTRAQKWAVLLSTLTLLLGLGNLGRAAMALRYSVRLPDLPTTVPLYYLSATAGFWGVAFIVCTVGLSCFLTWGRWMALAAVSLHQGHVWTNRLLFDASDFARQVYPRDLALTVILLLIFWVPLNLPGIRKAFRGDGH